MIGIKAKTVYEVTNTFMFNVVKATVEAVSRTGDNTTEFLVSLSEAHMNLDIVALVALVAKQDTIVRNNVAFAWGETLDSEECKTLFHIWNYEV